MVQDGTMSAEDLENYETDMELQLYREYRDVVGLFSYVVETERRFYLANHVDLQARSADGEVYFELTMQDAWVWDVYRSARFVKTSACSPSRTSTSRNSRATRTSPCPRWWASGTDSRRRPAVLLHTAPGVVRSGSVHMRA